MTKAQGGRLVRFSRGTIFYVELEGNPSTGFEWQVTSIDSGMLVQQGAPVFAAHDTLMGSAGLYRFEFRTIGPGKSCLRLEYFREWETDTPAADSFQVTIEVKGR